MRGSRERRRTVAVLLATAVLGSATGCGSEPGSDVPGDLQRPVASQGSLDVTVHDSRADQTRAYQGSNLHERVGSCSFRYSEQGVTLTLTKDDKGEWGFAVNVDENTEVKKVEIVSNYDVSTDKTQPSQKQLIIPIGTLSHSEVGHYIVRLFSTNPAVREDLTTLLRLDLTPTTSRNGSPTITIQSFRDGESTELQVTSNESGPQCNFPTLTP